MAVTRNEVVRTAIRLLQEVGLDGLTLRRLARELGIAAPTLYWHVKDKHELLDLMAEVIVNHYSDGLPPIPDDLEWWQKIAEGMRRQYRALIHYRDGARVVAGNRPTAASLPDIEKFLNIWIEAGFPPDEALATALTMGDFIAGSALEFQAEAERQRTEAPLSREAIWEKMKDFPTLRTAAEGLARQKTADRGESFEHGLGLFIAGLRARHAELTER